ncbi:MAG: nicotinate-nucleotide--dimethylbenzimidazole phosphoribosyltransferase [Candidatus Binatia bacterium]
MNLLDTTLNQIGPLGTTLTGRIQARLDSLTKPRGSLGRLEEVALRCALIAGHEHPQVHNKVLIVCCGDHGVCDEGISAYPRAVTAQMVYNYLRGGAAISVLARQLQIALHVVDLGVDHDFAPDLPGLMQRKVAHGTANFTQRPAMTRVEARQAVETGIVVASEAVRTGAQLLGVGEMGIGNSTAAAALCAALSGRSPEEFTGFGAEVSEARRRHKVAIIQRALDRHRPDRTDPLGILASVGGYEIAGITGICLAGAALRVPVVVDGFIATAGAWVACALQAATKDCLLFAHLSSEQGHRRVLDVLQVKPLLDLGMRLGEGTGAALGMGIIDSAVRLLNEMATFTEAGVTDKG